MASSFTRQKFVIYYQFLKLDSNSLYSLLQPTTLMKRHLTRKVTPFIFCVIGLLFFNFQQSPSPENTPKTNPSQFQKDTAQAGAWMRQADMIHQTYGSSDSIFLLCQQAVKLCESYLSGNADTSLWKIYIHCRNRIGEYYINVHFEKGAKTLDKSLAILDSTLVLATEQLGEISFETALTYRLLGRINVTLRRYDLAFESYKKALTIRLKLFGESNLYVAQSYSHLGYASIYSLEYERAKIYYEKAIYVIESLVKGKQSEDNFKEYDYLSTQYYQLGHLYRRQSNYKKALINYQRSLDICYTIFDTEHWIIADVLYFIALTNYRLTRYDEATEYIEKAIRIFQKTNRVKQLADCYNIRASIYGDERNYSNEIRLYEKAIDLLSDQFGQTSSTVVVYGNISKAYLDIGDKKKALYYANKAIEIGKNLRKPRRVNVHQNAIQAYDIIGHIYRNEEKFDRSILYYEKALGARIKLWGYRSLWVARSYSTIAKTYLRSNNYDEALHYAQLALIANTISFNDTSVYNNPGLNEDILSPYHLLVFLRDKAEIFHSRSKRRPDRYEDLHAAYSIYKLIIEWRTYNRIEVDPNRTSIETNARNKFVSLAKELYAYSKQDSFIYNTFEVLERDKAYQLLKNLRSESTEYFSKVPVKLIEDEYSISKLINFYEKELYLEKNKENLIDSTRLLELQDQVFDLKYKYDSLMIIFKNNHSEYYQLKYDDEVVKLEDFQDQVLDEETALVEYLMDNEKIYAFVTDKYNYELIELKRDSLLYQRVKSLHNSYYSYQLSPTASQEAYQAYCDTLVNYSHQIYQQIFQPIEEQFDLPEKLIISADHILGYIPFETLITQKPDDPTLHKSHAYLLNDYQISYTYSATLLQEMRQKTIDQSSQGFLAFAPSFNGQDQLVASNATRSIEEVRGALTPLKYNVAEAADLQELLGGTIYTDTSATEAAFINEAPNYRIIHLATHGKANDQVGDYAYLAFAEVDDTLENELLYNRDLYNLRLNADMVVLSACETGIGELQQGEGIISLARGFSYAGAKSIVTSLWSVNDGSTKELMESFYTYLKEGLSKDAALRQAKLDYIDNNPHLEAHPFYWAAFVPIGDMQPIEFSSLANWSWTAIILVFLTGLFFFFKTRKPA